ncbi:Dihydrodipicolinate synthase DapA [Helicobacter ailurogastricus]|uniref:4-hydroxy-tetrahydrodipicolinate synthase n=1 Tax=Helicobacter ailurogastricus TaxID=1578720 RepID=A0A0K2Y1B5_9HELI|nr:4-hydroxy-tetrahydrodipicolinate synthase [Helicobacter ailurogastricus]BDQ29252.1 4-hydroxy-tetrahydrodipicolinate synthase [Helicobacter ailurogastricus]GMB89657.1 Dihydrodipicolinate synthase DapA [Helicobacter ailurogastricus]CRF52132.1 Dihydrodipicolinate synthase [Helicobacter ailurogastricus]
MHALSALITPFKPDLKVDEATFASLIERQIRLGMDACVPTGTTGESATLSHEEHMRCIEIALEVCKPKGVKVLAGVGSNATSESIMLAKFAQKAGADALLCVSPYYNRPTQQGLFEHYKAIANAVQIPLILYDVPARTGTQIAVETAVKLFNEVPNIVGIKEASGQAQRLVDFSHFAPEMQIYSGEDKLNHIIMASGGVGVISVTGNLLPDKISALVRANLQGDLASGQKIHNELYAINGALFCESNPIPIKACLHMAGLLEHLVYRLPLVPPSHENMRFLETILENYEVLK